MNIFRLKVSLDKGPTADDSSAFDPISEVRAE